MTFAKGADANRRAGFPDPTAGVPLWPKPILCTRCGVVKGTSKNARPGRCRDCADVEALLS